MTVSTFWYGFGTGRTRRLAQCTMLTLNGSRCPRAGKRIGEQVLCAYCKRRICGGHELSTVSGEKVNGEALRRWKDEKANG